MWERGKERRRGEKDGWMDRGRERQVVDGEEAGRIDFKISA